MSPIVEFFVPFERGDVLAQLHREGEVISEAEHDNGMTVRARVDGAVSSVLKEFVVENSTEVGE
jgi:GTPase